MAGERPERDVLAEARADVLDAIVQGGPPERLGGRILAILDAALATLSKSAPDHRPDLLRCIGDGEPWPCKAYAALSPDRPTPP